MLYVCVGIDCIIGFPSLPSFISIGKCQAVFGHQGWEDLKHGICSIRIIVYQLEADFDDDPIPGG